MIQDIWQHPRGFREEKEITKVGVKNHCNQCVYLTFREKLREKFGRQKCLKFMVHHAAGTGTCTQSGMTIPSYPSSEMRLGKFPDHTEFQSWIVNFRTEVCWIAKSPMHARFAVDQGNRSGQIAG